MPSKMFPNGQAVWGTRIYKIWTNMIQRCSNSKNTHYEYYGGKGVTVCEDWKNSKRFIEWAFANGYEENLTLDRINGDGNYEPGNCRWITRKEQSNNVKGNRYITRNGITKTVTQWAEDTGINKNTLTKRLNMGWSGEDLFAPVEKCNLRGEDGRYVAKCRKNI